MYFLKARKIERNLKTPIEEQSDLLLVYQIKKKMKRLPQHYV